MAKSLQYKKNPMFLRLKVTIIIVIFKQDQKGPFTYRKILKISPGAQVHFSKTLFEGLILEGLIFGGAYLRREICLSKSTGLALQLEVNLPFLLCFTLYLGAIFQVQAPEGLIFWRDDLTEGFLCYQFGGLIFGGAYTWRGLFSEFYGNCIKE